jgi:hypothetical protein
MAYHPDKSAAFVGLERVKGTVGGRRGSLVLQHVGIFADGAANASLTVVSGTDELKGATGSGSLVADPGTNKPHPRLLAVSAAPRKR